MDPVTLTRTYETGHKGGADTITCRLCSMTSYHPEDIRQRYCGHCHVFHGVLAHALRHESDTWIKRDLMPSLPADSQKGLAKLLGLSL